VDTEEYDKTVDGCAKLAVLLEGLDQQQRELLGIKKRQHDAEFKLKRLEERHLKLSKQLEDIEYTSKNLSEILDLKLKLKVVNAESLRMKKS